MSCNLIIPNSIATVWCVSTQLPSIKTTVVVSKNFAACLRCIHILCNVHWSTHTIHWHQLVQLSTPWRVNGQQCIAVPATASLQLRSTSIIIHAILHNSTNSKNQYKNSEKKQSFNTKTHQKSCFYLAKPVMPRETPRKCMKKDENNSTYRTPIWLSPLTKLFLVHERNIRNATLQRRSDGTVCPRKLTKLPDRALVQPDTLSAVIPSIHVSSPWKPRLLVVYSFDIMTPADKNSIRLLAWFLQSRQPHNT